MLARPQANTPQSWFCAGRSGSSPPTLCLCAAPSSYRKRPGRDAGPPAAGPARGQMAWWLRSWWGYSAERKSAVPFEPEVLGKLCRPKCSKISRSHMPTCAHCTMLAGGPGSRSNTIMVGHSISFASESEGCSSMAARFAIQTIVGQIVGQNVVDVAVVAFAPDGRGLDPVRPMLGGILFKEEFAVDSVGIALQGQRPSR